MFSAVDIGHLNPTFLFYLKDGRVTYVRGLRFVVRLCFKVHLRGGNTKSMGDERHEESHETNYLKEIGRIS